ncbi:MAG TPA: DUF6569 family protein [Planctomycetota bacterium]
MSCETTTARFSDYFDGGLTAAERRSLEDHLRACSPCTGEWKYFTESIKALHQTKTMETSELFMTQIRTSALKHLDKKENLLRDTSESATVVTPLADRPSAETRRFEAPPRAPLPAAWIAAGVAVAFGLGFLFAPRGKPGLSEEDVRRLLAEDRARRPAVHASEPLVVPPDVPKILAERGLVEVDGQWMPARMRDDFKKGLVCVGGRMMPRKDAAEILGKEFPSEPLAKEPSPEPTTAAPTAEDILDRAGFTKVNDVPVLKVWVEKWGEGLVQTGPNEWRKIADFREDFIRDHGLVEYRGKLMTREQAEALQAQMLVRAPETATATNDFTKAIDGLQIGPPMNARGITVYPLIPGHGAPEPDYATLHDAIGSGKLEITDSAGLFAVQVKNPLERDLVLFQGEVLSGGRSTRVVAETTVVLAGQTGKVPVLCVEPGAWRAGDRFAKESGHYIAPPDVRRSLVSEQGQGAVWSLLSKRLAGRPGLADLFRKHAEAISEVRGYFGQLAEREAQAVGLAVAVGDSIEFVEIFRDRELFQAAFDRVVAGAALDALEREGGPRAATPYPNSVRGVKQFLETAFFRTYETREGGYGVRDNDGWIGEVRTAGAAPLHALVFATAAPEWDRRAPYTVPQTKLKRAVDDTEARLKTLGPARKISALRDLATINAPEVTTALTRHLAEPDGAVRRAVIQELGLGGDFRATDPLLQLLARSRTDPPQYLELVKALARLGDERAVDPLLRQLEAAEVDFAKALIQAMPELLLQARSRDVLDRAVSRFVLLFESVESAVKGEGADPLGNKLRPSDAQALLEPLRTSLRLISGLEFSSAANARKWWSDREARERYLKERTGK